eukprot:1147425-Pelagomonas_calceolata.AAC.2
MEKVMCGMWKQYGVGALNWNKQPQNCSQKCAAGKRRHNHLHGINSKKSAVGNPAPAGTALPAHAASCLGSVCLRWGNAHTCHQSCAGEGFVAYRPLHKSQEQIHARIATSLPALEIRHGLLWLRLPSRTSHCCHQDSLIVAIKPL